MQASVQGFFKAASTKLDGCKTTGSHNKNVKNSLSTAITPQ
jgi:hypothetical protein